MLRHARSMWQDPLGFLLQTAAECGPVVELPIPGQRVFLVSDPAAVQRVLRGNHRNYSKATVQYRSLAAVTGTGLLTSDGEVWLRHRRALQPAFHHSTLGQVGGHVATAAADLATRWGRLPDGSVVDVDAAMMATSLEVVGRSLFSADLHSGADPVVIAVLRALGVVVARARFPVHLPDRWPTPGNRAMARSVRVLDTVVQRLVDGRRAPGDHDHPQDLLALLLDPAVGLSDREVRDEIVTLIVAGHETVASALTWAWWLVSGHPTVADRLAEEARSLHRGRPVTLEDYPRLPFARQVLDEALRLYPPAWVLTRRSLGPDRLAGFDLPAGALVIMSPYVVHRDPSVWPRPELFQPERFAGLSPAQRDAYLPFGAGPRLCIGRDFALVEGVLLLSVLAGRFRLERLASGPAPVDASVTLRPRHGLEMRLRHLPAWEDAPLKAT
jgi:cytochrome P450